MKVEEELKILDINYKNVDLGVIELFEEITYSDLVLLKKSLLTSGLVVIEDKRSILIEKIKTTIIEMVHHSEELPKVNYSDFLSEELGYDYTYLSNLFSDTKGITIQQFIIIHKIEKVKELMLYDSLTLTEIAHSLHYSSTSHLSNQFKKITGLSPSHFKRLQQFRIQNIENL
jgi:AraC-like DNA-binding protein